MEPYKHERLKLSANSIRLFQVQGGSKKDVISLRITQYATHRRPSYVAISYTWGSGTDLRVIRINGRPFRIHVNLWDLLYHLRQRGESRFFWADALCIDQQNLAERNFHVQLMGQIYDKAETTIVWLGLASDDRREARAMEFVREMADYRKGHSDSMFQAHYLTDKLTARWNQLFALCKCVYWSRTWIIQEFLRAQKLEVICGTASLSWEYFESLVQGLRELYHNIPHTTLPATFISGFMRTIPFRLTARRISQEHSTLQALLHEFHDSRCTEPRDKVYGILGIADDCGEEAETGKFHGPQPDYSKHIIEVYYDVINFLQTASPTNTPAPLTTMLVQKALGINYFHITEYAAKAFPDPTTMTFPTFEILPTYINVIQETLPPWQNPRDLRQKLDDFDWSKYVGYRIEKKPSRRRDGSISYPSTQQVLSPLPDDLVDNMINAAELEPTLTHLYNYPTGTHFHIPLPHILAHPADKSLADNASRARPTVILEQSEHSDPVRLGFACSNTQPGDLLCQFAGMDVALVARRAPGGLKLVGKALMINHRGLRHAHALHPAQEPASWVSYCHAQLNDEAAVLQTDPFSAFELLAAAKQ